MAMAGHLLQLKQPSPWTLRLQSLDSVKSTRPRQCRSLGDAKLVLVSSIRFGSERWRHGVVEFGGRVGVGNFGLGGREVGDVACAVSGGREGEARQAEVVSDEIVQEDSSSFPAEFKDLIVDRGDPPNLYLFAAGFVVIVLMRDVILQELARWGINLARLALYIAQGITLAVGKVLEVGSEPITLLMELAAWASMIVGSIYTLILDSPVQALALTLFLSLAVLSLGDAPKRQVTGSRSKLVSIAAAIGLAGALEAIPVDLMLLSLIAISGYAHFVQKADLVTVFMPASLTFVAIASPFGRAAAFALFLAVSVYANWKSAREFDEPQTPREFVDSNTLSPVFTAITALICISLSARFLSLRAVKWLLLRSV